MAKPKRMRDAIHRVRMWTLSCSRCSDYLEAYPPEKPESLLQTAKACKWIFKNGEVWCEKCKAQKESNATD